MKTKDKVEIILLGIMIIFVGYISYLCIQNINIGMPTVRIANILREYQILDKSTICVSPIEIIYSDDNYDYYFNCKKSQYIYLEWSDGSITQMTDELNNKTVTMESLIEHGLNIEKREKNEN